MGLQPNASPDELLAADSNLKSGTNRKRQAGIANRADMLLTQKITEQREDRDVLRRVVGCTQIEVRISEVEVAVRKHQRVAEVGIEAVKEGGVIRSGSQTLP